MTHGRDGDATEELVPLTPVAFEILLSLVGEEQHGYAIMKSVADRSSQAVTLHAGTLYRALARLVETGLIGEVEGPPDEADGRRRYYRITPLGRRAASAEARRLESQVGAARTRGLLGRAGTG